MADRMVILDTETTGLEPAKGHRIIEIGCVELVNRKLTGNDFHVYLNPERQIEEEAIAVHGISNEFLQDKPRFAEIASDFMDYVNGAELVIHNAPFDTGFLNHELRRVAEYNEIETYCAIRDTLVMARKKHPGQRNSLDALCKRYSIDNSSRTLHGALLDAQILADVYLAMTGGQVKMLLDFAQTEKNMPEAMTASRSEKKGRVINASSGELEAHQEYLRYMTESAGEECLWQKLAAK